MRKVVRSLDRHALGSRHPGRNDVHDRPEEPRAVGWPCAKVNVRGERVADEAIVVTEFPYRVKNVGRG